MQASWPKTAGAVEFIRTVAPQRVIGIHDGQINGRVRHNLNYWLETFAGANDRWLPPGTTVGPAQQTGVGLA